MGDSSYNFSLTTFSKTGKLLQIEYALNRVLQGKVALGIRGNGSALLCLAPVAALPRTRRGALRARGCLC